MKPTTLNLIRLSPCGKKKKTYYFSAVLDSYPAPALRFTAYEYSVKQPDGKWKITKTFSPLGHPSNLSSLTVPDFVWQRAKKLYMKQIKNFLVIHHHEGTYAVGDLY